MEMMNIPMDAYKSAQMNKNNLSYWFPKIKDCGFNVPKTQIIPIPADIWFAIENDAVYSNIDRIKSFVETQIVPKIDGTCFCKNGTYSGKYNFQNCITNRDKITYDFISICYSAACNEAEGNTEFVLREIIPFNTMKLARIYNGLPLRTEVRVFYDFDIHSDLYSVNYWDYNYVYPNLYDRTDRIVFNAVKGELKDSYDKRLPYVMSRVNKYLTNIDELKGKWSVDLLVDDKENVWLIDMALAEQSAYWRGRVCT